MRILALICARAGSKGVPGKNFRPLNGKPLIAWSIETALECNAVDKVVVSTDGQNIADIALEYGAEVPCLRPDELAGDDSLQIDAIRHMVMTLEDQGESFDAILLLQPTCPIRNVQNVESCIDKMLQTNCDTVISLIEVHGGASTLYRCDDDGHLKQLEDASKKGILRQKVEGLFHRSGSIYLIKRDVIINEHAIYGPDVRGVVFDPSSGFNIDTEFDWQMTAAWVAFQKENKNE